MPVSRIPINASRRASLRRVTWWRKGAVARQIRVAREFANRN
jgi:hypothetical protein